MKVELKTHSSMLAVALCGLGLFVVRCAMKQTYYIKKYQEHAILSRLCKDGLRTLEADKSNWARQQRRDPHIGIDASITTPLNEEIVETIEARKYHERMKAYYNHACRYPWLY